MTIAIKLHGMNKHRSFRKRLSDHLDEEHDIKKPKRSRCHRDTHQFQYQDCRILPDVKELHIKHKISSHVEPNIDKGDYDSWQHYLNTQFNLLREDFVAPLRTAVLEYENGDSTISTSHTRHVYLRAKFTGMVLHEDGVLLTVEFETEVMLAPNTFINGTLLCFSSDNFNTILFATVVVSQKKENQMEQFSNRGRYHVSQGIQVKVESDMDNLSILGINESGCISNNQTYTVIKSPAHYETYYHVLKYLQNANPHKMPFTDYLIAYRHKMRCPLYLTRNVHFNMAEVLKLQLSGKNSRCCFNITNKDCWPSHGINGLDESQVKALRLALTHEVALIQGPPGTGKSYIGGKIMEALLINKAKWDPEGDSPILVVSYTNQALDQFFEKIIDIKSKQANNRLYYHGGLDKELKCNPHEIVRIGGGCKDSVSYYLLKNLKSADWKKEPNKKGKLRFVTNDKHNDFLCAQRSKIAKLSKKINRKIKLFFESFPTIEDLSEFIDPAHLDQLKHMHKCTDKCIEVWLQGKYYKIITNKSRQSTGNNYLSSKNISTHSKYNDSECHAMENQQLVSYTKAEAQSIDDINSLSTNERKQLFNLWIKQFRHHQYNEICALIGEFNKIHKTFIDSRDRKHFEMLRKAHVICMTTTGAAKHRQLLEKLKPKIVIAEEAAEVFESHIIACLTTATEHLILIGDDQQLQPNPSENMLTNNYYKFQISLFERLKNNGVPCTPLLIQHRMRPEIADLVRTHVYSEVELKDHPSVQKYDNIKGITTNMYFFDHKYPEKLDESAKSYFNEEEGHFIIKLCHYLLKHYKHNKITVLAAYSSQVDLLEEQIQGEKKNGTLEIGYNTANEHVEVKTIDNYQGEENTIIILSLVRSNEDNGIGFLKNKNRTCVALSRAKEGLYCFGNFTTLSKNSRLWKDIFTDLQKKKKIGSVLQLCCVNHQMSITDITKPKDFEKVPEGGCWRHCNKCLDCRHRCMLKCHITNQDHKDYKCRKTCLNKCKNCGKPCKHKCYIPCSSQKCEASVEKIIPKCNHRQFVPCYMDPEEFKCQEKCNKICFHGHSCNLMCSEECKPCTKKRTKILDCGHKVTLYCFENYAVSDCTIPCNKTCTTNAHDPHKCTKRCSDTCGNCEAMVQVTLPWCGHKQKVPCHMQHDLSLFADMISCTEMIATTLPTCGHTTVMPCGEDVLAYSCCVLITTRLPCGHNKDIECYKTQGMNKDGILASKKCFEKVTKIFQKCKHVMYLPCHKSHLTECPVKCNTVLLCGHKCSGTCNECHQGRLHKPCMFHVSKLLCGHETTMKCSSTMIEPYPSCSFRCERFCPHKKCSHKCQDPCKPCNKLCDWQCPHYKCTRECYERCNRPRCYEPCPRLNKCRHPCIGVCGERCPDVCKICDEEQFLQLYVSLDRFKTKYDTTYIQLNCGHLFKRTELDPWVDARSKEFRIITCPKCNQTIHLNQKRYANAIRRTYDDIMEIRHTMNRNIETDMKLEVFMRYHMTIINAIKVCGLSNLETLQGLNYEELEQFDTASDEELKRFAVACRKNIDTKFCQGIKEFIDIKTKNWLPSMNIIIDMFDSIFSLLKFSHRNLEIKNSIEVLLKFTVLNHRSLSLQVIQDVTREQKRLALWIMTNQLKREILDHSDLQTVKQIESVLTPGRFTPQLSIHLYSKISQLANKYGTRPLDKKYTSVPKLPLLYTGRWTQCSDGHYYCIPQQLPEVPCDFSTSQCPHCTENDDDDNEDMDIVNARR